MPAQRPRMIEARFVFQTAPSGTDDDYCQFAIAVFLRDGELRLAFDLHGAAEGAVENVDINVATAILSAVELVKGKVKAQELREQVE